MWMRTIAAAGVRVSAVFRWCFAGMFSAGRISLMLTGCSICVGGSVDYSDWPCVDCAVDFSPGEIRIGYIRQGLWTDLLIDAAPVTGSLIDLSDCLIVLCTVGFSSTWTFCSADFVLLAGFVLSVRRVNDFGNMAADGAAEVRAGITFGVELYVPWDAPEVVVDVSSEGVVPLRNIPDVIGLVGRREGAAESHVLQGRDVRRMGVRIVGEWTRTFTMLPLSIWGRCRSRRFPFRSCRLSVNTGPRRSSATWGGVSKNWKRCVWQLNSSSVRLGRVAVFTVGA